VAHATFNSGQKNEIKQFRGFRFKLAEAILNGIVKCGKKILHDAENV
jgi:hypothetical protein